MMTISTFSRTLLTFGVLVIAAAAAPALQWPVKTTVDLSSGFGDYRANHFHAGVDIRTGGAEGLRIFSPVDGYVSRVKMSYTGYGRALYVTGKDGRVYVWGHLSAFIDRIADPVIARQIAEKRYPQDILFPVDSIKVTQGELIAWSGQSGNGGPHLHLEERTADNKPLNPLSHGFALPDKTPPVFRRIGFQMTDDRSLFDDGSRKVFFDVKAGRTSSQYYLDTTLYFHRPLGLLADCYDLLRPEGMPLAVYSLALYFDDLPYFTAILDTVDYATTDAVNVEYDFLSAAAGDEHVRRLFKKAGDTYAGSQVMRGESGVFGVLGEKLGKHQGRIVATDCSGNQSTLTFSFLWGPPGNIVELDSTGEVAYSHGAFFFKPIAEYKDFGIDSLRVFVNQDLMWYAADSTRVSPLGDGRLRCDVFSPEVDNAPMRIFLFGPKKSLIRDNVFAGIHDYGKPMMEMAYDLTEGGLLISLQAPVKRASKTRVELYYRGTLLGVEFPQFFNMKRYICFIPPQDKYARIDRIGFAMSADTTLPPVFKDSLNLFAIGLRDSDEVAFGDRFKLAILKSDLYQPIYIEASENYVNNKSLLALNTDHYKIAPELFACRKGLGVAMKIELVNSYNKFSGICRLDLKKNRWVWLDDNKFDNNALTARVSGGGSFAGVIDYEPPEIFHMNIKTGAVYNGEGFEVAFKTRDTLSGIPEDQGITVKIDGQWLPAEYDPETEFCRVKPSRPLPAGEHHLGVIISDRAGNVNEQYARFRIR